MLTHSEVEQTQHSSKPLAREELRHLTELIKAELQMLLAQHAAVSQRIRVIKITLTGLGDLFGAAVITNVIEDEDLKRLLTAPSSYHRNCSGLTNSCRLLLNSRPSDILTVKDLLTLMHDGHPDLLAHNKHLDNSLRIVLKRLVAYGEAVEVRGASGVKGWRTCSLPG